MLSTLSKLKSHLGIPQSDVSKDAVLKTLLAGSSGYIEGQTARQLGITEHSLKLSGDGTDMLVLPQYPIMADDSNVPAISALTIDDVDVSAEIASGAIDVDAVTGILYRESGGWRSGLRNIAITFKAGYRLPGDESDDAESDALEVPDDLQLAAIRLAARIYERRTAEGTTSVSPASYTVNYAAEVDGDIKATIGRYSRMRVGTC